MPTAKNSGTGFQLVAVGRRIVTFPENPVRIPFGGWGIMPLALLLGTGGGAAGAIKQLHKEGSSCTIRVASWRM